MISAAAAAANLLFEFKIPEKKDEILMKNKKGKVISKLYSKIKT